MQHHKVDREKRNLGEVKIDGFEIIINQPVFDRLSSKEREEVIQYAFKTIYVIRHNYWSEPVYVFSYNSEEDVKFAASSLKRSTGR